MLDLQSAEQFLRRTSRLRFQPENDRRPSQHEWVRAGSPMAAGFRAGLMCRADLASLPSGGETIEKRLKVGISVSVGVGVFASRQACKVSLHSSDFVQESQRVAGHRDCLQKP